MTDNYKKNFGGNEIITYICDKKLTNNIYGSKD